MEKPAHNDKAICAQCGCPIVYLSRGVNIPHWAHDVEPGFEPRHPAIPQQYKSNLESAKDDLVKHILYLWKVYQLDDNEMVAILLEISLSYQKRILQKAKMK